MLSGHHRYILIAYNCQKRLLYCTVISASIAVILGFALVPLLRGRGAAWSLLIANIVNFIMVYVSVRQLIVDVPVHRQMGAPLATLAVSAIIYFALAPWSAWGALAAGTAMYAAGLSWFDGRQLLFFLQTLVRRPEADPV